MKRSWLLPALAAGLLVAAGCGANTAVKGTVLYEDGRPVTGATVVFVPVGGGTSPTGYTGPDGHFTLKTGNAQGARRGKYKVLITRPAKEPPAPMEAGSADAIKAMKKTMPKSGPPRKAAPAGGPDNELEARYASAEQTPLSAELPAAGGLTFTVKAKTGKK
jgi:Carboxypeptidase regulatory-like domain